MKKKLTKIMFLIGFFLVSFFVSQNVFAYTEVYSENFDSYTSNSCISYQNGSFGDWTTTSSNVCLSSVEYSSNPNSLNFSANNYSGIGYEDFSLISGSEVSAVFSYDVFLVNNAQYALALYDNYSSSSFINFAFTNNYNNPFYLIQGDYNGSGWVSGDYDLSEYLIDKESSWVKISFLVNIYYDYEESLDSYVYKFSNSIYIDNLLALTYNSFNYNAHILNKIEISGGQSSDNTYIDNFTISDTIPSSAIDGVCGSANSSTFDWADFDNQDFCSAGNFYLSGDNGERIIYACEGLNGGITQYNCSANYYYNGACGSASNSSFSSLDISNTDLCSSGYVSESSFLESGSGWTWVCSGSGSSSFCNATKSLISFPEMPEETDCSSLTFPDNLLCNIENLLKTGFLPSAIAMNNLNNAVNQVQQKAPFNYLNVAIEKISGIKDNITSESISMSLMGNSSTLNINSFTSDFMPSVKSFFTLMIVFGFIFWGIAYIKHFFK